MFADAVLMLTGALLAFCWCRAATGDLLQRCGMLRMPPTCWWA